jgi:hypothetical protein
MKKTNFILICSAVLFFAILLPSQEFTYVGAQKCKLCHKSEQRGKQYNLWENSRHSKSYEVLFTESALEEAKKQNLEKPPSESPECLKCHGPLYDKVPELKVEGVTCEVCHGPGSAYKKLSVMKNQELAQKNGLVSYTSDDEIKAKCVFCHGGESFHFYPSWKKIKHPIPKIK